MYYAFQAADHYGTQIMTRIGRATTHMQTALNAAVRASKSCPYAEVRDEHNKALAVVVDGDILLPTEFQTKHALQPGMCALVSPMAPVPTPYMPMRVPAQPRPMERRA